MPPPAEVRGWSRLLAGVADQVLVGTVQDMHRAISDGAYRWIGPVGRPVQRVTDAATDAVYAMVRGSLRVAGEVGAVVADRRGPGPATDRGPTGSAAAGPGESDAAVGPDVDVPTDLPSRADLGSRADLPSPAALKARAIAHGVVGEELMQLSPELDLDVTVRADGREVPIDPGGLRDAYPHANGRVAVFIHGLVDTEAVWFSRPAAGEALPDLARAHGATPVLVRYGTGRSVGRNGADLAVRLEQLVEHWPVPVTELVLVGHSMGGLLVRAAGSVAAAAGHRWVSLVGDVLYLGTPHAGSWLEKVANTTTWILRRQSRSAPIGTLVDGRSRGIKDLRYGTLEEDAFAASPIDDLLSGEPSRDPLLADVRHHLVVGRLRSSPRHPLNVVFGDALVRVRSASGTGTVVGSAVDAEIRVVEVDASHTRLVRSGEVATLLREVLAS